MSKIRINQIRSEDTVSQAEAEAGTSTSPKIWTPERVKQAITALGGSAGGGLDNIELSKYLLGGWHAYNQSTTVQGWGIGQGVNAFDSTSGASINNNEYYFDQFPSGVVDNYVRIYVTTPIVPLSKNPIIMFKFSKTSLESAFDFFAGFYDTWTEPDESRGRAGLTRHSGIDTNLQFTTCYNNVTTYKTDTGVSLGTDPLIFILEIESSTKINFWLYDDDMTLLASASHTSPPVTFPSTFSQNNYIYIGYKDKAGNTTNGLRHYAMRVTRKV